jgi:transcription antitermination protein NusB
MAARSKARKRALDVIFESEVRGFAPDGTLAQRLDVPDRPLNDYTVELVRGVAAHLTELDDAIATYAEGWTLGRMPSVDRNVLRLAAYEILHVDDVPDAVAVSEALELVRELSTDESPAFVNGVLGAIVRHKSAIKDAGTTSS